MLTEQCFYFSAAQFCRKRAILFVNCNLFSTFKSEKMRPIHLHAADYVHIVFFFHFAMRESSLMKMHDTPCSAAYEFKLIQFLAF